MARRFPSLSFGPIAARRAIAPVLSPGELLIAWGTVTPPLTLADLTSHLAWSLLPGIGHVLGYLVEASRSRGALLVVTDLRVAVLWSGAQFGVPGLPCMLARQFPIADITVECVAEACFRISPRALPAENVIVAPNAHRLIDALAILVTDSSRTRSTAELAAESEAKTNRAPRAQNVDKNFAQRQTVPVRAANRLPERQSKRCSGLPGPRERSPHAA